jgi:hypothetical protein
MVDWGRSAPSFCGCCLLVEMLLHDAATFAADEDERPPRATAEQALEISRSLLLVVCPVFLLCFPTAASLDAARDGPRA